MENTDNQLNQNNSLSSPQRASPEFVNTAPQTPPKNNLSSRKVLSLFLGIIIGLFIFAVFLTVLNYFNIVRLDKIFKLLSFLPREKISQNINKVTVPTPTLISPQINKLSIDYNLTSTKLDTIPKQYDPGYAGPITFSKNGKRVGYIMANESFVRDGSSDLLIPTYNYDLYIDSKKVKTASEIRFLFSTDSKRVIYAYINESKSSNIVIDGMEYPVKGSVLDMIFSPDSKNYAFSVLDLYSSSKSGDLNSFVVFNGKKEKNYIDVSVLTFSPSGNKLAYIAKNSNGEYLVVINGKEGKSYKRISGLTFSSDSSMLVYLAQKDDGSWNLVKNGLEIGKYKGYNGRLLSFSPDVKRIAYRVEFENKEFMVIDGKNDPQYDTVDDFIFSSDGKRTAYFASKNKQYYLILDGVETKVNLPTNPVFSPDSKNVSYIDNKLIFSSPDSFDSNTYLVINGKRFLIPTYVDFFGLGSNFLSFSPDSKNFAYIGENENEKYFMVINNNKKGQEYDEIFDPAFSPDSKKIMYGARLGNELWWVVDDVK